MAFKVTVGLKDAGEYSSFSEAFKVFFREIKRTLEEGTSWQALETTNFIIHTELDTPMDFYTARDFAYDTGLMAGEGELQENAPEPPPEIIKLAFMNVAIEYAAFVRERIMEIDSMARNEAPGTIE